MVPMTGSRVKKILERIGCENVEDAWAKGEPVDDGAAKCDWLEEIFDDIPRLRENGGLLLMKTEDEVVCFEDRERTAGDFQVYRRAWRSSL